MTSRSSAGGAGRNTAKKAAAKPRNAAKPSVGKELSAPNGRSETAAKRPAKARADGAEVKVALRLKELIDRVVATVGVKKKDAKPVIEATLKHLGDALEACEYLVLQPLGRLRVSRAKAAASGDTLTVKLKRPAGSKPMGNPAQQGLAEDGE